MDKAELKREDALLDTDDRMLLELKESFEYVVAYEQTVTSGYPAADMDQVYHWAYSSAFHLVEQTLVGECTRKALSAR